MQLLTSIIRQSLLPQLAAIQKESSRKWLKKHLPGEAGVSGLHIGCGSGENTFLIASLLKGKYTLIGLEDNPDLIEMARITKASGNLGQVCFQHTSPLKWKSEQPYDFVYSRIWVADLLKQENFLTNTKNHLKENGRFILELIQLSGFSAYPYNPAFSRSAELISKIEQTSTHTSEVVEKCIDLLENQGLQIQDINYSLPTFLDKKNKNLLSKILTLFEKKLLQLKLVKAEEFKPLLLELQRYEASGDALISRPGVYQILAKKQLTHKH